MSLPPSEIPLGAMRFNSDSQKLEYWEGSTWLQIQSFSPNIGNDNASSGQSAKGTGVRGMFMGGDPSRDTNMDYVTIPTRGNAIDFGDFSISNGGGHRGIVGTGTRGFSCGGESPSQGDSHNFIGSFEFATTGSSIDFANLTFTAKGSVGLSNATRAVITRGYGAPSLNHNDICFFTMASQQDASDFGNNQSGSTYLGCGTASPTRGIIICGRDSSGQSNTIEYVTISTTGNTQEFGDVFVLKNAVATCAGGNSTRGVLAGGEHPNQTDVISYLTYATTGNTTNFGNLSSGNAYQAPASDRITLVTGGGPGPTNRMDAVAIATGGTGTDFGDLTVSKISMVGSSNGHGGLG